MKKVLFGVSVAMMALASQASYLYWQVDASDYSDYYKGTVDSAILYMTPNGTSQSAVAAPNAGLVGETTVFDMGTQSYESYSFYVELMNYSSTPTAVARSGMVSYADLASSISSTLSAVPQAAVWHAANYSAAPEPTSALLVMMGVAFLGLKRRKA